LLKQVIKIAKAAGNIIMQYYGETTYKEKSDHSPVTKADIKASEYIVEQLECSFALPVISEEVLIPYEKRKNWDKFWLVDPLDGTKDFLEQNGEFTVNIALIEHGHPVIGVVFAPVLNQCWWAQKGNGAFKDKVRMKNKITRKNWIGTDSRHHSSNETVEFFKRNNIQNIQCYGSSLKMCKVAEGEVDIYPRLNGTKEWDTAAAEIILLESKCHIQSFPERKPLKYNKKNLKNPFFVACRQGVNWK